jgi:hypothetical protein
MPKQVIKFDHRDIAERELFLLSVDELSEIFPLPERENSTFALLLAMNGKENVVGDLGNVPEQLLKEGLVYLCAWGEDCERIHDIFDEVAVQIEIESNQEMPIMTTWHNKESLDEALWFLLYCAIPDDLYYDTCKTVYVVSVGNNEWSKQLENGLVDIDSLDSRVAV